MDTVDAIDRCRRLHEESGGGQRVHKLLIALGSDILIVTCIHMVYGAARSIVT